MRNVEYITNGFGGWADFFNSPEFKQFQFLQMVDSFKGQVWTAASLRRSEQPSISEGLQESIKRSTSSPDTINLCKHCRRC